MSGLLSKADAKFEEYASVHEAFPNMEEGIEMLDAIFKLFAINVSACFPWFDRNGRQNALWNRLQSDCNDLWLLLASMATKGN